MANTIILKRSATPGKVPTTAQLALGEIAINTYDGLIYIKKDDGTPSIAQIGGVTSVNSKTGSAVLNSDDISDSGRTNKWFSNTLARGAVSAGTGISYNSGTGVISTSQNIATSASPTFAGLTLTGNMGITGNIVPSANNTYSLGSSSYQWKDLYVGPGTLYVNGKPVISDTSGTMTFSTDTDQNMRITTQGAGVLQLGSSSTNVNVDGTLQMATGKRITDGAGVNVQFGNAVHMNSNKITNLGAPSSNTDAATKKYVDDTVSAISTSSISQGNSNVTVTDTGTGTVTVSVDGSTALTVDANGVTVAGNFTVSGTTTTVNSNTIALADNIITLNSDHTGAPTQNAGLLIERGDEADTQIRWNEGSDIWQFTNNGAVYYPMATSTDDLAEGSTNLYHTTARARGALSATSATGVSYNSSTGVISLGSIPNSALSNNSITINGTSVALGGTRTLDTDAVSEGSTNLYFTNTRARGAVSATAGTGLSYNGTTGAFSLGSIPNSSLSNTSVTVGTTAIALGASSTTLAGLTSVSATTFTGALSGNATTATTLQNARTINGVSFDGSANVTTLTAGTGVSVSGTQVSIDTGTTVDKTTAQTLTNKSLSDSTTYFIDETDGTKKLQFQVSGITTGTTRTLTAPDASGTIATTAYVDSAVAGKDNTDEITEGTTNLYFTTARARASVSAGTGISYNSTTGAISTSAIPNASLSNSSVTVGTTAISLGASSTTLAGLTSVTSTGFTGALTGNASTATALQTARTISGTSFDGSANITLTTTGITEGTNLYYTDTRARAAVSGGTGITVSAGGVIATTITQYTDALARAAVSFTAGSGAYNSTTGVFTIPTNTSQLTNGANFITLASLSGTAPVSYNSSTGAISMAAATSTVNGYMTSTYAAKLDGIASGATANTGTVTSVVGGTYLTGGTITTTGTLAVDATSANTASKVVARDASGNFSAGTITATLSGNASTATTATNVSGGTVSATTGSFSSTVATGALTVTGGITATGEITAYYSDDRLKKDVVAITDPINKIMAIRGVTFRPNQTALDLGIVDKEEVGVIAQEIQAVLPQLVTGSAYEGYITVKYEKLTALLIEAVKAQQLQIDELKASIAQMRGL